MTIRERIGGWLRKSQQIISAGLTPMSPELVKWFGGGGSASGKVVNDTTAMTLSAAWSCMRIISEAIGTIPWAMYERSPDGSTRRADDHPLAKVLIGTPNADMTSVELRETCGLNLCQEGNAYSLIERLGNEVVSIYPVPSCNVTPKRKKGANTRLTIPENEVFYSIKTGDYWLDYTRDLVWHVKGFGNDGFKGLSPISAAREVMGFALATEEFGSKFFTQGGKPSGIVSIPNFLNKDQREIARENLQQLMGGLGNAHKFVLMEGGMKPEAWGDMTLNDMSFILSRKFSVQEICRIYRIPPHMVADVERGASYASIEQMSSEFVMFTLLPYFTRFESSVTKWLLRPEDRGRFFLRFNYEALLRADSKGRADFYASALQNGWMTRNEVRAKENLNQAPGLNEFTAQTNLAPVGALAALATAAATRGSKPDVTPEPGAAKSVSDNVSVIANVALPALLRHEVEHAAPGVKDLVTAVRQLNENHSKSQESIAQIVRHSQVAFADQIIESTSKLSKNLIEGQRHLADSLSEGNERLAAMMIGGNERLAEALAQVAKSASAKRRLLLDAQGNPIGNEPVEESPTEPRIITTS